MKRFLLWALFLGFGSFAVLACRPLNVSHHNPVGPSSALTATTTPTGTLTPIIEGPYSCTFDEIIGYPLSGELDLPYQTRSFIPLCNGWILVGDRTANQIHLINVVSGAVSQTYQLTGAPNEMAYDGALGLLYVGIDLASSVACINLGAGSMSYISLDLPVYRLASGPSGKAFVTFNVSTWYDSPVALVSGVSSSVVTIYNGMQEGYLTYDFFRNQLIRLSTDSAGTLSRYLYNSGTNSLNPVQTYDVGDYCLGFVVSPSDNHLAVSLGNHNAAPLYSGPTLDLKSTNLNFKYGEWAGQTTVEGDFSPDNLFFLSGTNGVLRVYDVSNHASFQTYSLGSDWGIGEVSFSTGGKIIYGLAGDYYADNYDRVFWYLFP